MKQAARRLLIPFAIACTVALLPFVGQASVGRGLLLEWHCDNYWVFEWCNDFPTANIEELGGLANSATDPEDECQGADMYVESWFEGPLFDDDGYDDGGSPQTDYVQSNSHVDAPNDSSFYGVFTLVSNHWYEDFFNCGSDELQMGREWQREVQ